MNTTGSLADGHDNKPTVAEELTSSIEETTQGVAVVDKSFVLRSFNSIFDTYYQKVVGKPARVGVSVIDQPFFIAPDKIASSFETVLSGMALRCESYSNGDFALSVRIEPAFDEKKNVIGAFLFLADESAKELDFKKMVENSGDAVIVFSPEGKPTYVSPSVMTVLGYTPEEVLQLDIYAAVHPDDLVGNQQVMEKSILNPGIPIRGFTSRILHKDGTYHLYESSVVNLLGDPSVGGIVDNIREITDNGTQQALGKLSQGVNSAVAEAAQVGVWEVNLLTGQSVTNHKYNEILGYTEPVSDWSIATFLGHVHPDDRRVVQDIFDGSTEDGSVSFETRIERADSFIHWVAVKGRVAQNALGEPASMMLVMTDVTEKYQLREALLQSESRLKNIIQHLSDGLIIATEDGRILHWNPMALAMHGFDPAIEGPKTLPELLKFFKLYDQDGTILPMKKWPLLRLINKEPINGIELKIRSRRDSWGKMFRYNGGSFQEASGSQLYFLTIADITNLNSDRKIIKENEERFLSAFYESPVALLLIGKKDGVCIDINKSAEKLLGYSHEESVGKTILELNQVSEADFQKLLEVIGAGAGLYHEQTIAITTKSGKLRKVLFSTEHVKINHEEYRLVILTEAGE